MKPKKYKITLKEDYSELEDKTEAKDLVTLSEWLLEENIDRSISDKHRLARLIPTKVPTGRIFKGSVSSGNVAKI